jgi:hypothetical protein
MKRLAAPRPSILPWFAAGASKTARKTTSVLGTWKPQVVRGKATSAVELCDSYSSCSHHNKRIVRQTASAIYRTHLLLPNSQRSSNDEVTEYFLASRPVRGGTRSASSAGSSRTPPIVRRHGKPLARNKPIVARSPAVNKRHPAHSQPAPLCQRLLSSLELSAAVRPRIRQYWSALQLFCGPVLAVPRQIALLEEEPAAPTRVRAGRMPAARGQPGLGSTDWVATAMNTSQPLAAAPLHSTVPRSRLGRNPTGCHSCTVPAWAGLTGRVATAMLPAAVAGGAVRFNGACRNRLRPPGTMPTCTRSAPALASPAGLRRPCRLRPQPRPRSIQRCPETGGGNPRDALLHGIRPGLGLTGWIWRWR